MTFDLGNSENAVPSEEKDENSIYEKKKQKNFKHGVESKPERRIKGRKHRKWCKPERRIKKAEWDKLIETASQERKLKERLNRKYKDSVFIDLFSDPKNQLELLKSLHPEMSLSEKDIKLVTLKELIMHHPYNDLALQVKDRLIVLVEAQSTWSLNILIRLPMYYWETVRKDIIGNNTKIFKSKKVLIPRPEYYVIYTGNQKNIPKTISLREDFFGDTSSGEEVVATVIYAETTDIIGQYIIFCHVMNNCIHEYGPNKNAALMAIQICQDNNVLKEYLSTIKWEVTDNMITLFDEETMWKMELADQKRTGMILGSIYTLRDLGLSEEYILQNIMQRFHLEEEEAKEYLLPPEQREDWEEDNGLYIL